MDFWKETTVSDLADQSLTLCTEDVRVPHATVQPLFRRIHFAVMRFLSHTFCCHALVILFTW